MRGTSDRSVQGALKGRTGCGGCAVWGGDDLGKSGRQRVERGGGEQGTMAPS